MAPIALRLNLEAFDCAILALITRAVYLEVRMIGG